jgi:DNA-binding CsgD family transcriptional regulator
MNKTIETNYAEIYFQLLCRQRFVEKDLDYSTFHKQVPMLQAMAALGNSGISVFDTYKKEHIFYSPNFSSILGYDIDEIIEQGHEFLDSKIHEEDYVELMKNGVTLLKLFYQLSTEEKKDYKLVNEYRVLNASNRYIRVLEQHQALELDKHGNIWLTLSTVDISPDQDSTEKMRSQLLNIRTGKIIPFKETNSLSDNSNVSLTQRELEILQLVKGGYLSKEISDKLSISVHTVNTHRQRLLGKLNANNSMEAVVFASKLGLV